MTESRGLYAYALIPDKDVDVSDLQAIADAERVETLTHEGLRVVFSEVSLAELEVDPERASDRERIVELARQHDSVIRAVFGQSEVLPLRFCTVLSSREDARRLVESHREAAIARLRELAGSAEWGVRVVRADPDSAADRPAEGTPARSAATDDSRTGTAYLRERMRARTEADTQRRLADEAHSELSAYASEAARRDGRADTLVDVAYLIDKDREATFLEQVDRVAERLPDSIQLTVTGPWPPYTFARLDDDG